MCWRTVKKATYLGVPKKSLALRSGTTCLNVCFGLSKITKASRWIEMSLGQGKGRMGMGQKPAHDVQGKVACRCPSESLVVWVCWLHHLTYHIPRMGKHLADESITSVVPREREISRKINSWQDMMHEFKLYIKEKVCHVEGAVHLLESLFVHYWHAQLELQTKNGEEWDGSVPTNYSIKGKSDDIDDDKNLGQWINWQWSSSQSAVKFLCQNHYCILHCMLEFTTWNAFMCKTAVIGISLTSCQHIFQNRPQSIVLGVLHQAPIRCWH